MSHLVRFFPLRALGPSVSSRSSLKPPSAQCFSTSFLRRNAEAEAADPPPTKGESVIKTKLENRFPGSSVRVQDVSGGCGTFYAIEIVHPDFRGKSMVTQHKMVQKTIENDIPNMHGLQIRTAWK